MRILIACEFSGIVREEFRRAGHDAISVDLLPSELDGPHIIADIRDVLGDKDSGGWDMMIGFPPCTYLANSGVRWLVNENGGAGGARYKKMKEAIALYLELWRAPIRRICLENSRMHYFARMELGGPDQIIQPWMFGHGEKKGTWLSLKNLPKLVPTNVVEGRSTKVHDDWWVPAEGGRRWKERSRTYEGVAKAMVEQWGGLKA